MGKVTTAEKQLNKTSLLFLKFAVILIAIVSLCVMIRFPQTEGRAANLDLVSIYKDPFVIYLYIASIPFFAALYHAFTLLGYIEQNNMFSKAAMKTAEKVKYYAMAYIGFVAVAILYVFVLSKTTNDDGAGAMMMGFVIIFISAVIAASADVFKKLLQKSL
jgi:hypothetical protein